MQAVPDRSNGHRSLAWVVVVALVPYLLFSVYRLFAEPAGHDQTWYLYAAGRMLSGVTLYGPRLLETNPPLIIWFSALPVLLGHLLPIGPVFILRLLVLLILLASVAWCLALSRRAIAGLRSGRLWLLGAALLFVGFGTGPHDFAQREQIFVLLALPYLLAVCSGIAPRLSMEHRLALGVAAGFAICFKPQEAIVLIVAELYLLTRGRRPFHPEIVALIATCAAYLALVRTLTPLYTRAIVPILVNTYWAFGNKATPTLLAGLAAPLAGVLLCAAAYVLLRRSAPISPLVLPLLLCTGGAMVAYYIQHAGWSYHSYPIHAFLELSVIFLLLGASDQLASVMRRKPILRPALATVALVIGALLLTRAVLAGRRAQLAGVVENRELSHFFSTAQPGETVYIFSPALNSFSNIYNRDLVWGSRFAHLWMLPAIVRNLQPSQPPHVPFKRLSPDTLRSLSTLQQTESADDLTAWKPTLVLVEHCSVAQPCQAIESLNFDILSWFLQSPRFAEAWSHYRRQPDTLSKYDIYRRTP